MAATRNIVVARAVGIEAGDLGRIVDPVAAGGEGVGAGQGKDELAGGCRGHDEGLRSGRRWLPLWAWESGSGGLVCSPAWQPAPSAGDEDEGEGHANHPAEPGDAGECDDADARTPCDEEGDAGAKAGAATGGGGAGFVDAGGRVGGFGVGVRLVFHGVFAGWNEFQSRRHRAHGTCWSDPHGDVRNVVRFMAGVFGTSACRIRFSIIEAFCGGARR